MSQDGASDLNRSTLPLRWASSSYPPGSPAPMGEGAGLPSRLSIRNKYSIERVSRGLGSGLQRRTRGACGWVLSVKNTSNPPTPAALLYVPRSPSGLAGIWGIWGSSPALSHIWIVLAGHVPSLPRRMCATLEELLDCGLASRTGYQGRVVGSGPLGRGFPGSPSSHHCR